MDSLPEKFEVPTTLVALLQERASQSPSYQTYTFLRGKENQQDLITNQELDRRARAIGARLQRLHGMGERALLVYQPGLEYIAAFFGCLYAGVIAVPVYPPRNHYGDRLQTILQNAQAKFILTTTNLKALLYSRFVPVLPGNDVAILTTDDEVQGEEDGWREPAIHAHTTAFLQYTSGSTGMPKGVMLSHNNLLHNLACIYQLLGGTPQSRGVIWLPPYHDMGLIGGILGPLYGGSSVTLLSPMTFLQQPLCWLNYISATRATASGGPNFAYDLCVRKISKQEVSDLDLSCWEVAFDGAEPISSNTIERFTEAFAPYGFRREAFYPCYGLAEATLLVSAGEKLRGPVVRAFQKDQLERGQVEAVTTKIQESRTLVSVGKVITGQTVVIMHPQEATPCAPGEVGEVWVSGTSVAMGYWNNERETERVFRGSVPGKDQQPFLRTGDLGFLYENELFITGRLKDIIIIRGRNHYPQDIERTVAQCSAALLPYTCAAFAVTEEDAEEKLVIVQEVPRRLGQDDMHEISFAIRQAVIQEHGLQVYDITFIKSGTLPKTSSGKIQHALCRTKYLSGELEVVARHTGTIGDLEDDLSVPEHNLLRQVGETERQHILEKYLLNITIRLLSLGGDAFVREMPLINLGLDSMAAMELRSQIETNLGVKIPLSDILQSPGLAQIAREVAKQFAGEIPISCKQTSLSKKEGNEYPLSQGQRSLWFLQQLAPESTGYNIVRAVRIRSQVDIPALRRAFQGLIRRHEVLRTTFHMRDGDPVQVIHEEEDVYFSVLDTTQWTELQFSQRVGELLHTPFDLAQGPLMKIYLFIRSHEEYMLLFCIHHIIADLRSFELLISDLSSLYTLEKSGREPVLPVLGTSYVDFVIRQQEILSGDSKEKLAAYWKRKITHLSPLLNLPFDYPRSLSPSCRGAAVHMRLSRELVSELKRLCKTSGTTFYMLLLTAFETLLYRYTDQQCFQIYSPIAGRDDSDMQRVVGYFVNLLPLQMDISGHLSFLTLLEQVKRTVLEAFEHCAYPFDELVKHLNPERTTNLQSFFQVLFVMQSTTSRGEQDLGLFALGEEGGQLRIGDDLLVESLSLTEQNVVCDIALMVAEAQGMLTLTLEYCTDVFRQETMMRMLTHFQVLLEGIISRPDTGIAALPLLAEFEAKQLLSDWNAKEKIYDECCLHQLVEIQIEKTPDSIAVVFEQEQITYRCLNEKAKQLASTLQKRGAGSEKRIGICMERSLGLIIGILGILKAGAAYVPLDPDYPSQRLAFIIDDSQVMLVLIQHRLLGKLPALPQTVIMEIEDIFGDHTGLDERVRVTNNVCLANLAYVIYTSGSTGQPKGAMITHAAIGNRLHWMQDTYQLTQADRVLQKTTFSFDVSLWEIFWPLLAGASLVMARPGGQRDTAYLVSAFAQYGITTTHFVPSLLQLFLEEKNIQTCTSLRKVFCSGEALSFDLQQRFFARMQAELHNLYGPTEAAVDVTYWACQQDSESHFVPIGYPIGNIQIYLLDRYGYPVAVGIPGELYIGGKGIARGYFHRPDLTAEKFVPHPLSKNPGERLYRTGDVACYLPDGAIKFLGRLDYQVKLRGFRIELEEIEAALLTHPRLQGGVVVARENTPEDLHLVAYVVPWAETMQEMKNECVIAEAQDGTVGQLLGRATTQLAHYLREYLQERLPDYMLPSRFVVLDELPLTSNNKLDRTALPAPVMGREETSGRKQKVMTDTEAQLAQIWKELLHVEMVHIEDNFFEAGGHSLLLLRLIAGVRKIFDIEMPVQVLFRLQTIEQQADYIERFQADEHQTTMPPIRPVPRDHPLPLSFAQQRLWFADQLHPDSFTYNVASVVSIDGHLNVDAFVRSLNEVVRRHEILRTTFTYQNDVPVQVIGTTLPARFPWVDLTELPPEDRETEIQRLAMREAQQPFSLAVGPLLRIVWIKAEAGQHVILFSLHHIICDGWSVDVLIREITALYNSFSPGRPSPLPELPVQYGDFAVWQRKWLQGNIVDKKLEYWCNKLNGIVELKLPFAQQSRVSQAAQGGREVMLLPSTLLQALKILCRQNDVTLFMMLLAVFKVVLYFYSRQDDIAVSSSVANRMSVECEELIGFFVNTVVLRTDMSGNPTFRLLLQKVRDVALEAYEHQDLPFERVVEELRARHQCDNLAGLVKIKIVLQNAPNEEVIYMNGVKVKIEENYSETSKYDMTFIAREEKGNLKLEVKYDKQVFEKHEIERFMQMYEIMLRACLSRPALDLQACCQIMEEKEERLKKQLDEYVLDKKKRMLRTLRNEEGRLEIKSNN